ncbi:ABC transporter ATP-binding protein [Actinomyces slackii]|nr:ABC transporter ATP-binding protein [Actinomyces slackii]
MWSLLLRLVSPREMKAITAWFIASAVLQGLALGALIPFLRALYSRSESTTAWMVVLVVAGLCAMAVDMVAQTRSYRVSVYEICDTMISRIAEHVLALPLGWFSAARQAAVVNATSREINTLSHVTSLVIPNLCNAFIVPLVMIGVVAAVEWQIALIMALTIVPLYIIWRRMRTATTRANEIEDATAAVAAGRLIEFARLQPVLRASGLAESGWQPVREALAADADATAEGLRVKGRPAQAFHLVANASFALIMAVGLAAVSGHRLDVIAYLAVMAVTSRMLLPLTKAAMYSTEADNAIVALRAVNEILSAQPLPDPAPGCEASPHGSGIELRDVDFSYDEGRPVLDGVSLTAPAGRVTALVGPSGAGKSTVLRLVARFWDTGTGSVTIGGADVEDLGTAAVMGLTSMVFQEVYLFDTTIRENLRIARPQATQEELDRAARRARLDGVIESLPDGWDTRVGPAGTSLSGGERQRVAIARAFLKDAPILLLDEITSALDGENESAIAEVVRELSVGRTVLMVAHRISTIQRADEVVFLQPGPDGARVAQRGRPEELGSVDGPYRDFLRAAEDSARWRLAGR